MCYSRSWEAEEAKGTEQQAKDKQAQARRNERVNELLTEAQKQAKRKHARKDFCPRARVLEIRVPGLARRAERRSL